MKDNIRIKRPFFRCVQWTPYVLILPLFIIILFYFVVPLFNTFLLSFSKYTGPMSFDRSIFTLENYKQFFASASYHLSLITTLRISLLTTFFCVLLGYPAAYYMSKLDGRRLKLFMLVYLAPWLINVVVKAYGWIILISNNGIINEFLLNLNIIDKPIRMLFTETCVIVGVVHGSIVFAILPIYTSLKAIDPNLYYAAENLGSTKLNMFLRITLPLTRSGIVSGVLIVFAMTMAAYTTPVLLGGSRNQVLSSLIYKQSSQVMNLPFGAAIAFVLVAISVIMVAILQQLLETGKRRRDLM